MTFLSRKAKAYFVLLTIVVLGMATTASDWCVPPPTPTPTRLTNSLEQGEGDAEEEARASIETPTTPGEGRASIETPTTPGEARTSIETPTTPEEARTSIETPTTPEEAKKREQTTQPTSTVAAADESPDRDPGPAPVSDLRAEDAAEAVAGETMEYPEFSLVTRDVSNIHLTNQATSLVASDYERTTETVEELLEKGWYAAGASPVHIAIRGTPREDSVRCEWHGVARTPAQREEQIRFLLGVPDDTDLPSPADVETILTAYAEQLAPGWDERSKAWMIPLARGKLSVGYLVMSCYADYAVSEYILGRGPSTVTVAFEQTEHDYSYDVYLKAGESRGINMDDVPTRAEFREDILDPPITGAEAELKGIIVGRENVLFLIPMGVHDNIAIEAWQSVAQWDLQTDDGEVLQALRYGVDGEHDEYSQTLANLKSRIATGATSDSFARERISNISGLNQYYQDMGAYSDISPGDGNLRTFTPAKPLATLSCAGASAVTDPATKFGLVRDCSILLGLRDELRGTATLNWSENLVLGNWTGITTTGSPHRITAINLPSQSLNGIISPALGKLDALEALDVSSNSLTGLIPASLGQLPSLATLRLSGNFLSGCIPPTLRDVATNDLASVGLFYCDMPPPPSPSE